MPPSKLTYISYLVPHGCSAKKQNTAVVSPLYVVKLGAINGNICTIEDLEALTDQTYRIHPIPYLVDLVEVRGITSVGSQASAEVDEAAVGNAVFVIVTFVEREDLPTETATTRLAVPADGLTIEHCLREL